MPRDSLRGGFWGSGGEVGVGDCGYDVLLSPCRVAVATIESDCLVSLCAGGLFYSVDSEFE